MLHNRWIFHVCLTVFVLRVFNNLCMFYVWIGIFIKINSRVIILVYYVTWSLCA